MYLKKIIATFIVFFLTIQTSLAALTTGNGGGIGIPQKVEPKDQTSMFDSWSASLDTIGTMLLKVVLVIALYFFFLWLIRVIFEMYYAKNLVYLKVSVPKSDSKLDKEKETKKDFKEKIGMMNMFYKAIHKLDEAGMKDTILNFFFRHSKVSLEITYHNGNVDFYIVTYKSYVNLVSQHITSVYTDAEVLIVDNKDVPEIKPQGYMMRTASLNKEDDDVFPMKTYKYLEDDPLNNFTNVFSGLNKEDRAVFQVAIKPAGDRWSRKAKKAAGLVAK